MKSRIREKLRMFWSQWGISHLVIFFIAFGIFFFIQYTPSFPDPDSFYHMKMAELFREGNFVKNFPWLSDYTVLGSFYGDQHFLYHLFLVPFVILFPPPLGIKIATIFLAALLVGAFYTFLRAEKIRFAFFFSFLLLWIEPFIFRMSLAKAPSVSLLLLLGVLFAIFRLRPLLLFFLSAAFVWAYGAFPLAFVAAFVYTGVSEGFRIWERRRKWWIRILERLNIPWPGKDREGWMRRKEHRLVVGSLLGIILGLFTHPHFPGYLRLWWVQFFQIGIQNYQNVIGVGGEWYPYTFATLIPNAVLLVIFLVPALVVFSVTLSKQTRHSWTFLILMVFFFLLTLKSRRYVEYFVPVGMLFSAFSLNPVLSGWTFKRVISNGRFWNLRQMIPAIAFCIYLIVMIPTIAIRDLKLARAGFIGGIPPSRFQQASRWLAKNTQEGSLVLHSDWDEFPVLFYHNTHNRYIVGLDPTFMYLKNPDRYWSWVRLTKGEVDKNAVAKILEDEFQGAIVFVAKDHTAMKKIMEEATRLRLVYEDHEAAIYKLTNGG